MQDNVQQELSWLFALKREALISHITHSIQLFQISDRQKLRNIRQLGQLLDCLDGKIDFTEFNLIFKTLTRALVIHKDSPDFVLAITSCAEKLSSALSLNALTDQVFLMIDKEVSKDALISLTGTLTLLKCLYSNHKSFAENPKALLETVVAGFLKIERALIDQPALIAVPTWRILEKVIQRIPLLEDPSASLCEDLFRVLVTVRASLQEKALLSDSDFDKMISHLAQCFGMSRNIFIEIAVNRFIGKLLETKIYETWDAHSIERRQFVALVTHCGSGVINFLDRVVIILAASLKIEKDLETRFESLEVLNSIVQSLQTTVDQKLADFVLSSVIAPSLIWKVGKPNNKIRKAGVLCFIAMVNTSFTSKETVLSHFDKLLSSLKSCLSDDWAPDLRFATLELMELILGLVSGQIPNDSLQDFYASILDRLDDAQEDIRVKAAEVLQALFQCSNCTFSSGIKEYILKILFVHFDDSNEVLQEKVFGALEAFALRVDKSMVLDQAKANCGRLRYPTHCAHLIQLLEK
jgi:hypothetical protein